MVTKREIKGEMMRVNRLLIESQKKGDDKSIMKYRTMFDNLVKIYLNLYERIN